MVHLHRRKRKRGVAAGASTEGGGRGEGKMESPPPEAVADNARLRPSGGAEDHGRRAGTGKKAVSKEPRKHEQPPRCGETCQCAGAACCLHSRPRVPPSLPVEYPRGDERKKKKSTNGSHHLHATVAAAHLSVTRSPPIPPTQSETYMEGEAQQSTKETQEHVQLGRSIRLFQRHRLQHKRDCRVGPPRVIVCRPAGSGGRPRHVRRGEG